MLERFEKFIKAITEIELYWHRLSSSVMKEYDLRGNYAVYFVALDKKPEGLTPVELAEICGKDKADVSRDTSALEKRGLINKKRDKEQSYRARIVLTDKGAEVTRSLSRQIETAVSCIGGGLDEKDRHNFYRVLDEIASNMHELSKTGIPKEGE